MNHIVLDVISIYLALYTIMNMGNEEQNIAWSPGAGVRGAESVAEITAEAFSGSVAPFWHPKPFHNTLRRPLEAFKRMVKRRF